MKNKSDLLTYFSGLDVATLQKLEKYSRLLIVPDEDLLTNVTMIQMVEKAHNLADSLFPEWTDRSKSDFGQFLVELFALYSEKDFWYINAFANENILKKMRSYSNTFSKVSSLGYYPITCKGAVCDFKITVDAGASVTYERGDLSIDIKGVKFTNDVPFSIGTSSAETSLKVTLHQGIQIAEDTTYNGYSVFIRKQNIDVDSINVIIDNVKYTRVKNFGNSSSESTHFMVLPEEDGSASIHFGSNGFGVAPLIGKQVRLEYRRCEGSEGNIQVGQCTITDCLPYRMVTAASMITEASGGFYAETLTSIKERAPLYFSTKRAAVNESVAESILNSFTFVHKSKVSVIGREMVYRIIPSSGYLEPTKSELEVLKNDFTPYVMAGYTATYATNSYKNFILSANPAASKAIIDVIVSPGYNVEAVEAGIRQIMEDLTNPLIKAEYGGSFSKTTTDILIRSSVPGVQSTTFKLLVGTKEIVMPDFVVNENEILRPIVQTDLIVRTNVY